MSNVIQMPSIPNVPVEEKEKMVQALVVVHSCLIGGQFPGKDAYAVGHAIQFIQSWHKATLLELESDPEYIKKQEQAKKESDGQAQSTAVN